MKNRTEKNVLRSSCGIFAAALVLLVAGATTTWAGYHWMGGGACSAYNNNQANKLERSHVRLLNPATNTQSLWVICSPDRDATELTASLTGGVFAFFDTGVTTDIQCVWREFYIGTIHVPGGDLDAGNTINAEAFTILAPVTTPGSSFGLFIPTTFTTVSDHFYSIACKLPPGTGINGFGYSAN
jgi:hypothetical protein